VIVPPAEAPEVPVNDATIPVAGMLVLVLSVLGALIVRVGVLRPTVVSEIPHAVLDGKFSASPV
jgi:hypothetical protein